MTPFEVLQNDRKAILAADVKSLQAFVVTNVSTYHKPLSNNADYNGVFYYLKRKIRPY